MLNFFFPFIFYFNSSLYYFIVRKTINNEIIKNEQIQIAKIIKIYIN